MPTIIEGEELRLVSREELLARTNNKRRRLERAEYWGWITPIGGRRKGASYEYVPADVDALIRRFLAGEEPPLLPSEVAARARPPKPKRSRVRKVRAGRLANVNAEGR